MLFSGCSKSYHGLPWGFTKLHLCFCCPYASSVSIRVHYKNQNLIVLVFKHSDLPCHFSIQPSLLSPKSLTQIPPPYYNFTPRELNLAILLISRLCLEAHFRKASNRKLPAVSNLMVSLSVSCFIFGFPNWSIWENYNLSAERTNLMKAPHTW